MDNTLQFPKNQSTPPWPCPIIFIYIYKKAWTCLQLYPRGVSMSQWCPVSDTSDTDMAAQMKFLCFYDQIIHKCQWLCSVGRRSLNLA